MSDLIKDKNFLLRINKFEKTILLQDSDFRNNSMNAEVINYIKEEKIESIEINENYCSKLKNLEFLVSIPEITSIRVIKFGGLEYIGLKILTNLRRFINNYSSEPINFSHFAHLKELDILWVKGRESFLQCESLENLTLHKYTKKNLVDLQRLKNLKRLALVSPTLDTLKGVESLKMLETLEIYYNSKLSSLSELNNNKNLKKLKLNNLTRLNDLNFLEKCQSIEFISISNCKNIKKNEVLFDLKNLRGIGYYNSGSISSIERIKNLKHLERFNIGNTNIVDGKLEPILKLERLVSFSLKNKKHYSLRLEDIQSKLNIDSNLKF